jgi:hypothetical protein
MFNTILNLTANSLTFSTAVKCTGVSLVLGFVVALCYAFTGKTTKNFFVSLVILPAMVQTVIMLVNGNLGTGVAIVGAFSLVRFRSIPGTSREISNIFFAMVVGLATGMGYITYAAFITAFIVVVMLVIYAVPFFKGEENMRNLKITIYENLDYTEIFDDIFEKYLKKVEMQNVKTVNMGSMYQLHYYIEFKDNSKEKEFIDAIRCRNGNLTVMCGRIVQQAEQL